MATCPPHDPESEKRTGFEAEAVLIRGRIDEVERERNLPRYGETQLPLASQNAVFTRSCLGWWREGLFATAIVRVRVRNGQLPMARSQIGTLAILDSTFRYGRYTGLGSRTETRRKIV